MAATDETRLRCIRSLCRVQMRALRVLYRLSEKQLARLPASLLARYRALMLAYAETLPMGRLESPKGTRSTPARAQPQTATAARSYARMLDMRRGQRYHRPKPRTLR